MLPVAAADHYRQQQRLTLATIVATRRAWSRMGFDFDASWLRIRPQLRHIVSAGQLAAARGSADYMTAVLAETGQVDAPVARARPQSLVGVASDGRSLDGLLDGAIVNAKYATRTLPPDQALEQAGRWLDGVVQSTIADASRSSTAIEMAIRPDIGGYVRFVNYPSCRRCLILSGKFFRWNHGFQRHPSCDCRHVMASHDTAHQFLPSSPTTGAVTDVSTTATGDGRRRMVPERILESAPNRDAAIELLRRYGFAA